MDLTSDSCLDSYQKLIHLLLIIINSMYYFVDVKNVNNFMEFFDLIHYDHHKFIMLIIEDLLLSIKWLFYSLEMKWY